MTAEEPSPAETPPAMRMVPSTNDVAVCKYLLAAMLPVAVNVPPEGSKSSALAVTPALHGLHAPPARRTLPSGRSVVVWELRLVVMLLVRVKIPAEGLSRTSLRFLSWSSTTRISSFATAHRDREREGRAHAHLASHPDSSPVKLDELSAQR